MSGDRVARLAAAIEVPTGAVNSPVAERVAAPPACVQGELLHILERAFPKPPRFAGSLTGRAAPAQADLARWMPIVAGGMVDAMRRQIACEPERAGPVSPERPGASSEMAERAVREHARGALARFENGRPVA